MTDTSVVNIGAINLYISPNKSNDMGNNDDNGLADILILGGLGYLLGQGKYNDWDPLIKNYKSRLKHLKYFKIPVPVGYLNTNENVKTVYRESILCYLFGLSNSAIPSLMRALEQTLIAKYEEVEKKKPTDNVSLKNLIDWAEKIIKDKVEIVHSFRMLRNYVHTDVLVKEQDTIEAIRHISTVIHSLFPSTFYGITTTCKSCGRIETQTIHPVHSFLGNTIDIVCYGCNSRYNWIMIP